MIQKLIHTPEGVRDIYGDEWHRKTHIKHRLHEMLKLYGYRDIETPTFEYSDIYSEIGTTPENEMYRFFDNRGNMMVLRPDFTPSIARCAAKYFPTDSMPIRLCYEGNVYINRSDLQGKLKETTQMGAELIGPHASADSDGEMVCLVIESLLGAGFTDFQVCLGNASYFKGLCEEEQLTDEQIDELRSYISIKNYFGAKEYLDSINASEKFIKGIVDVSSISSFDEIDKVKKATTNKISLDALNSLSDVYDVVCMNGLQKYISLDLCTISKFHYYTGIIFKAYTYGTGDAICKGGRYDKLLDKFGKHCPAVGFVFMVDDIMTALNAQNIRENIKSKETWIVYTENAKAKAYEEAAKSRQKGIRTSLVPWDNNLNDEYYKKYADEHEITELIILK